MFVLRLSILVQVSKKIFGIINKWGVQISIWEGSWKKIQKLTSRGTFIWELRVFASVNNELNKMNEWFIVNKFSLNMKKRQSILSTTNLINRMIFHFYGSLWLLIKKNKWKNKFFLKKRKWKLLLKREFFFKSCTKKSQLKMFIGVLLPKWQTHPSFQQKIFCP